MEDESGVFAEVEYEFDLAENEPSSTRNRDAGQGGYSRMHQEDTSSDELRISLVLKDKYRRDIEDYDPDKGGIFFSRSLPRMGYEPWTYVRSERGRRHALNDWTPAGGASPPLQSVQHLGYRQPGLDRPAEFHDGTGGLARMTIGLTNRWDPKHIKWPVNFEDLNWYLYELPGNYRESLWLYWLKEEGTQKVVFSAYWKEALPLTGRRR